MNASSDRETLIVVHGPLYPRLRSAMEVAGLNPIVLIEGLSVWRGTEPDTPAAASADVTPEHGEQEKLLLTVVEAARVLGIGRTMAYQLIRRGEIEVVHIGRLTRIPADSLPNVITRLRGDA